ncbi:unnamed protein product [Soboliphyme baturini]|uniref:Secreted protein n=1 Tax=Soboliphyme baturini TaxID=241478 RepID=A0A183IXJ9_9BILA|nr:unnamed protein product [Soboliphyme baturini]
MAVRCQFALIILIADNSAILSAAMRSLGGAKRLRNADLRDGDSARERRHHAPQCGVSSKRVFVTVVVGRASPSRQLVHSVRPSVRPSVLFPHRRIRLCFRSPGAARYWRLVAGKESTTSSSLLIEELHYRHCSCCYCRSAVDSSIDSPAASPHRYFHCRYSLTFELSSK